MTATALERISIEVTNQCGKACAFCYNASTPGGATRWSLEELAAFVLDCARTGGVRAVSFGGGEPLEYPGLEALLARLDGALFRSLTTNGLLLTDERLDRLAAARPDKVHVSIHFPDRPAEVARVLRNVAALDARGVRSGVNLLVRRSGLAAARDAARALHAAGVGNDRIVYLPMRGADTPLPAEVAQVAGAARFQSMTCLLACGPSPRFCSVDWDRTVAWCSYTRTRRRLAAPTYAALREALDGLGLAFCGGTPAG